MNKKEEEEEDYQRLIYEANFAAYKHNVMCFVEGILVGIPVGILLMIAWMI